MIVTTEELLARLNRSIGMATTVTGYKDFPSEVKLVEWPDLNSPESQIEGFIAYLQALIPAAEARDRAIGDPSKRMPFFVSLLEQQVETIELRFSGNRMLKYRIESAVRSFDRKQKGFRQPFENSHRLISEAIANGLLESSTQPLKHLQVLIDSLEKTVDAWLAEDLITEEDAASLRAPLTELEVEAMLYSQD